MLLRFLKDQRVYLHNAHQYSRVGFNSSVEVNEVNLNLSYGVVIPPRVMASSAMGLKLGFLPTHESIDLRFIVWTQSGLGVRIDLDQLSRVSSPSRL